MVLCRICILFSSRVSPLPWRIRVQSDGRRTGWIWGLRKDQVKCCSGPMHLQIIKRGRAREFLHKNCFQSSWMLQSPIPSPIDWLQRAAIVLLCFYKTCNLSLFFMLCLFCLWILHKRESRRIFAKNTRLSTPRLGAGVSWEHLSHSSIKHWPKSTNSTVSFSGSAEFVNFPHQS